MVGYAADLAFGQRGKAAPAQAEIEEKVLVGARAGAASELVAGATSASGEPSTVAGADGSVRRQMDWGRFAVLTNVIGWGLHFGMVVTRGLAADRLPWGNMYEFLGAI